MATLVTTSTSRVKLPFKRPRNTATSPRVQAAYSPRRSPYSSQPLRRIAREPFSFELPTTRYGTILLDSSLIVMQSEVDGKRTWNTIAALQSIMTRLACTLKIARFSVLATSWCPSTSQHHEDPIEAYLEAISTGRGPALLRRAARGPKAKQNNVSVDAGKAWNALPEAEKEHYWQLAKEEKEEHRRNHPDYRYSPRKAAQKPTVNETRTAVSVSERTLRALPISRRCSRPSIPVTPSATSSVSARDGLDSPVSTANTRDVIGPEVDTGFSKTDALGPRVDHNYDALFGTPGLAGAYDAGAHLLDGVVLLPVASLLPDPLSPSGNLHKDLMGPWGGYDPMGGGDVHGHAR
ncbi:hypothetical protein NMY22_g18302 [Coprinellus aureogranulatus]|nr:hypothetical protein NMY22_g18302 [Coprinellus aureogranulatus]